MGRGLRAARVRPKEPQRRCLGCKATKPQAALLRLVVLDGVVAADPQRKLPGRGCSICRDPKCAAAAVKGQRISRALRGRAKDPAIDRVLQWLVAGPVA